MGRLFFKCPNTDKDFDSGFEAGSADLKALPAGAKLKLRCKICSEFHEFTVAHGKLRDEPARRR